MGYLRTRSAMSGCGSCRYVGDWRRSFGDDPSLTAPTVASLVNAGDMPTAPNPAVLLQAELNRFAADQTPPQYKYWTTQLSGGSVDAETAARAVRIVVERGLTASADGGQFMREASAAITAPTGPVPWVSQNVLQVAQLVAGYADAGGLPPPQLPATDLVKTVVIVGAVLLGVAYLTKKAKSKRGKSKRRS